MLLLIIVVLLVIAGVIKWIQTPNIIKYWLGDKKIDEPYLNDEDDRIDK